MRFPTWMNLDWLLPFQPKSTVMDSANFIMDRSRRERAINQRLWLIDNRQESLRAEIAAARKAKKKHSHLLAEMRQLTTERMRLERE